MKKLFVLFIILSPMGLFAQDTTKVEQYCLAVASSKLFSSKVALTLDYGEERSFWKDQRLKDEEGKVKSFNSAVDAINYLGKQGWKMINAFPVSNGNGPVFFYYVFKKEFKKSETEESK